MRAIRWFLIRIAEIFILFIVVLFTLISAVTGYSTMHESGLGLVIGLGPNAGPIVGAVIGGVLGFVSAAVVSAMFFLLVEIANNTRRMVSFFEHVVGRGNGREAA